MTSVLTFLVTVLFLLALVRLSFLVYKQYRQHLMKQMKQAMRAYSAARVEWLNQRASHPEVPRVLGGPRRVIYLSASTPPPAEPTSKAA